MLLNLNLKQHGLVIALFPLLIALLLSAEAAQVYVGSSQIAKIRTDSADAEQTANTLVAAMDSARASLTSNERWTTGKLPDNFTAAQNRVPELVESLRPLTVGEPMQDKPMRLLAQHSHAGMSMLAQVIELSKQGQRRMALQELEGPAGLESVRLLHGDLSQFVSNEQTLRSSTQRDGDIMTRSYFWLFIGAMVDCFLVCILTLLYGIRVGARIRSVADAAQCFTDDREPGPRPRGADEMAALHRIIHQIAKSKRAAIMRENAIAKNSVDVVCSINTEGVIAKISPACINVWGYRPGELLGRELAAIASPEDAERTREMLRSVRSGKTVTDFESECLHRSGQPVTMVWSGFSSEVGGLTFCVAHDITQRKRIETETWHRAYHDALTDLPNRALFHDRLSTALIQANREGMPLAVMYMDMDRFKQINDTLGHDAGDALLKEVAHRLRSCLRSSDTVARMGGDEFTVLLPRITECDDACMVAEKITERLNEPWRYHENEIRISGSLGIAVYPQDAEDAESLLRKADIAQYQIKSAEKNGFRFYEPEMTKDEMMETAG